MKDRHDSNDERFRQVLEKARLREPKHVVTVAEQKRLFADHVPDEHDGNRRTQHGQYAGETVQQ